MITREDVLKKLLEAIDTYNSNLPATLTEKVKHIVAILEWVERVCIREGFFDLLDDDYFTYCEGIRKDYKKITGTLPNIGDRTKIRNTRVQGTYYTKPMYRGGILDKEYVSLRRRYEMSYPLFDDDNPYIL